MAKGQRGKFWRLAFKCALVLSLLFSSGLVLVWFMAPSWIENLFTKAMAIAGYEATLKVDQLGLRRSSVSHLAVDGTGVRARIGEIEANYSWHRFHRAIVELHQVDLRLDLDELFAVEDEPWRNVSLEQKFRRWGRLDYFERASFQDALLEVTSGDYRKELRLTGLLDGSVRPHLTIECNSSLVDFDLEINKYGYGVGLSGHLGIDDLSEPSQLSHSLLHDDWPAGLEVLGGKLKVQAGVRVKDDDFLQGVVQATVENLALRLPSQEENGTRWAASSSDLSLVGIQQNDAWEIKLGGDFMMGNFLQLDDVLLEADVASDRVHLTLKNVDGQFTLPDHQVNFAGLRGAVNLVRGETWGLAEAATFPFSELGYGGDEFVLYDGLLHLAMQGEDGPVSVSLPPCYALMPAAQVAFEGLSFEGALASLANPVLSSPQILRCDRVMLAEEPALEDLEMTFRVDDNGTILVDSLGFETNGVRMEFHPQRATFALTEDGGAILKLNATTIEFPDEELTIEGVEGTVRFESIDPLVIREPQELVFSKVTFADMICGPGHLAFALDDNGTFSLTRCEGPFLGGILRINPTSFNLFAEQLNFTFEAVFDKVDAEELVKAMPGFEGELRGLLSGLFLLSNREGNLNYLDGGHIQLEANPKGYLSYPADGLLTEGLDPKSANYKKSRLVELALQDLQVESLKFSFTPRTAHGVKIPKHADKDLITGEVYGQSMVGRKKINVNYVPRVFVKIDLLLRKWEFGGFSLE